MSNQAFDPAVQTKYNGPITTEFGERIKEVKKKNNIPYWKLADMAGFSGSFLGNVVRWAGQLNIGTPSANRLNVAVRQLEGSTRDADLIPHPNSREAVASGLISQPEAHQTVEVLVEALGKLGFGVILVGPGISGTLFRTPG